MQRQRLRHGSMGISAHGEHALPCRPTYTATTTENIINKNLRTKNEINWRESSRMVKGIIWRPPEIGAQLIKLPGKAGQEWPVASDQHAGNHMPRRNSCWITHTYWTHDAELLARAPEIGANSKMVVALPLPILGASAGSIPGRDYKWSQSVSAPLQLHSARVYYRSNSLHALNAAELHLAHMSRLWPEGKQRCFKSRKWNAGKYACTREDGSMNTVRPWIDDNYDRQAEEKQLRPTWAEHRTGADGPNDNNSNCQTVTFQQGDCGECVQR